MKKMLFIALLLLVGGCATHQPKMGSVVQVHNVTVHSQEVGPDHYNVTWNKFGEHEGAVRLYHVEGPTPFSFDREWYGPGLYYVMKAGRLDRKIEMVPIKLTHAELRGKEIKLEAQ